MNGLCLDVLGSYFYLLSEEFITFMCFKPEASVVPWSLEKQAFLKHEKRETKVVKEPTKTVHGYNLI
jgi:hypothetical protein